MPEDRPKYRVVHELGAGGMGLVWKGVLVGQAGFQRPLVIKQLRYANDAGHVQLFVDEARRYALLDHENIGRIFDFDRVGGELCIILEYIDGWTLVDFVDRHRREERRPEVDLCVFMVSRVCRALQYVFERARIVHRDISPSNIMMTREGTVKLIDFGIAAASGTRERGLTGKPSYMAPEMVTDRRADNRSDLFSLGAVLHELVTGDRLFRGKSAGEVLEKVISAPIPSVRSLRPDVPDAVETIVQRALERDPDRRFASAAEMGEACEHHLYDKGYGPTNLTLKRYLQKLFPEAPTVTSEASFPLVEGTLLPVFDARRKRPLPADGDGSTGVTPVAPVSAYTRVIAHRLPTTGRPDATSHATRTQPMAAASLAQPPSPPTRPRSAVKRGSSDKAAAQTRTPNRSKATTRTVTAARRGPRRR